MLVGRFSPARGDADDGDLPDRGVRPGRQVGQAGFLLGFPGGDGEGVGLARVAVPADLQPGLRALVPAQQDPAGGRVRDQRGRGDVQRQVTLVGITGGPEQRPAVSASSWGR
jgi:hypothetical protein